MDDGGMCVNMGHETWDGRFGTKSVQKLIK